MRAVRARKLRKIALSNHEKFQAYHRKKVPFKTFFRWVKESYNLGTLKGV